jgi:uncharacterized protein (TIGR02611 family)
MHARPATARLYRLGVAVVGTCVVALGAVLIPLPGPGWLIVFIGLSILASEFSWAERMLHAARDRVGAWTRWVAGRSRTSRLLIGASGLVLLAAFVAVIATWYGALPLERLSTTAM